MQQDKMICSIYRSSQKDEMYLYVDKKTGMDEVPETLLKVFGHAHHVMDILLTEQKTLARVKAVDVLEGISTEGFYLQMPPKKEDSLLDVHKAHNKQPS